MPLSLVIILEIWLQDLLLCDLITGLARFQNIGSVEEDIQLQKVSKVCFARNLIKTFHVPIVISISWY